ncbi:MAG: DUF1573 domain-containing protein [Mongoliitalea sp.]
MQVQFARILTLFAHMKHAVKLILFSFISLLTYNLSEAQEIERKLLNWQQKSIYLGPVLAENGVTTVEFLATNPHADTLFITDVITDCGCTVVGYSRDTLVADGLLSIKVSYESDYRGGDFAKLILVRTNLDIYGDTLILEGINFPVIDDAERNFPYKKGELGFRLPSINLGQLFTNEPKVKFYDVYNFGKDSVSFKDLMEQPWPAYVQFTLEPRKVAPSSRALLAVTADAEKIGDLGFFSENIKVLTEDANASIDLTLMGTAFEYFEPIPKSMEKMVPRLLLSESEIDFKEINSSRTVQRSLVLSNLGQEPLLIRKVSTNCDCVIVNLEEKEILPGGKVEISISFDPKGRRGIDHKHITLFTNDPINPVQTITLRSMIK